MSKKRPPNRRVTAWQENSKPFPVVNLRFRSLERDSSETCGVKDCQSQLTVEKRATASFLFQPCLDTGESLPAELTEKERGELSWEKAYRDQVNGKEPKSIGYPICAQCAAFTIMRFLGDESETRAAFILTSAVTTGQDIILFDRNLSRSRTFPSIAMGRFKTLSDFRKMYWQKTEGL